MIKFAQFSLFITTGEFFSQVNCLHEKRELSSFWISNNLYFFKGWIRHRLVSRIIEE